MPLAYIALSASPKPLPSPITLARRALRLPDTLTDAEVRAAVDREHARLASRRVTGDATYQRTGGKYVSASRVRANMDPDIARAINAAIDAGDLALARKLLARLFGAEPATAAPAEAPPAELTREQLAYAKEYGTDPAEYARLLALAERNRASAPSRPVRDDGRAKVDAFFRAHRERMRPTASAETMARAAAPRGGVKYIPC